jgi:D-arabinose 5-phosphate isomerase GutQ
VLVEASADAAGRGWEVLGVAVQVEEVTAAVERVKEVTAAVVARGAGREGAVATKAWGMMAAWREARQVCASNQHLTGRH